MDLLPLLLQFFLCWFIVWLVQQNFLPPQNNSSLAADDANSQNSTTLKTVNNKKREEELNNDNNFNHDDGKELLLCELRETREALRKDLEDLINYNNNYIDDDSDDGSQIQKEDNIELIAKLSNNDHEEELIVDCSSDDCGLNSEEHQEAREQVLAEIIQALIHAHTINGNLQKNYHSVQLIGQLCRNYLERMEYDHERNRITNLQSLIKRRFTQQVMKSDLEKLNLLTTFLHSRQIQNQVAEEIVMLRMIQSIIRGNSQYCDFKSQVNCTVMVQSLWKSAHQRRKFDIVRETCQTVQSFSRGRTMRANFAQLVQNSTHIQSIIRKYRIRKLLQENLTSIEVIQSLMIGRHSSACFEKSIASIETIQALLIGKFQRIKTKELEHEKRKVDCTSTLQATMRGNLVKREMEFQFSSAVYVQAIIMGALERKLLHHALTEQSFITNVISLQSLIRRKTEQDTLNKCRNLVLSLQSSMRRYKDAQQFTTFWHSAESIQCMFRGVYEMKKCSTALQHIEMLQSLFIAQKIRNELSQYEDSSLVIGAFFENLSAKTRLTQEKQSLINIQALSKGFLARDKYENSIGKTVTLQANIRAALVTIGYKKEMEQITNMQALQKGAVCRKVASSTMASILSIGGLFNGKTERFTFLKSKSSVYNIQASIIGSTERKKVKQMYTLSENIIALRERKLAEKHLVATIQKLINIQSLVRSNNVIKPTLALTLQSNTKGYLIRRETHVALQKAKALSGFLQATQARKEYQIEFNRLIQLQAIVRGKLARKSRIQRKSDILCLQGLIRGYLWRNESYLYIPNTSLAIAPISVTETIKRIFEDEITEESSDSSPTEVIPPTTNRRVPSFDAVTGGRSKLSQLIKDKVTKSPVLDLSNMNIESLPTIGTDCSHITDLNLSKNMLVTLPEWFCDKFPNLRRLNLSGNRFFDTNKLLSENISPISQTLTFLDLSKNRLEYFELHYIDENDNVETTNFPNLTSLNLSYNQLLNVSSEMFELVSLNKLENLDLSHNQLLTFPTLKSSDLLKRWKDFKFINLEHNSFLQSEIGKIFYMFKKRPDILKQLKGQLYKRGAAKESDTKAIDDLEINSEIGALMEEETQTEMTEMAYHDQFKTNLTSLGSVRTINTNSDYDSEDDELMTDRSFYSSTSNLSSERGISPRHSSPALSRKSRANSASPFLLGIGNAQKENNNTSTEKTDDSPTHELEKDIPELDSPKTPRLELLGQTKPIAINVLTPISGQAKYSFIQDIPMVQSTNTPTFTPPDYETKTVNIPKLNLNSSLSPNTPNNQLTLSATDNFLSTRSASSDMSTPNSSLSSPVVESENLIYILNNDTLKDSFKEFCEKEHSGESIEFYEAVASFKNLANPVEIRDLACNIYDLFINPIGKHALNINKKQIDKVKLDLFKDDGTLTEVVSTGTFDSLLYCVKMNLMDPLKRYKATQEFKKLDELVKTTPVDIPLPRPKWGTARHPLLMKVGEQSKKQFRRKKIPYLSTPKPANSNTNSSEDRTPPIQGFISPRPERKSINIKQMKNRINNLMEILHSERKYLSFLIDLWEMYYVPLVDNKYLKGTEQPVSKKRKSTSEQPLGTSEDSSLKRKISFMDKIFNKQKSSSSLKDEEKRLVSKKDALEMFPANLFTIITFNKSFLVSLEERFALYSEEQEGSIIPRMYNMMIGDIFEKSIPYFRIYENYLETYESCMNKIRQIRAQNKEFDTWIKKRKSHPRSRNLEINSLLVVPVQRVVRYKLLIENLIETTEEDHPDYIHLLKALDMIVDVANQQNNNIRVTNNRVKVRMLTQLFDFYEQLGASSISSGGVVEDNLLIREGDLEIQIMKDEKSSPKRSNKVQRAYLFTNVIIFVEKTKQVDKQITQEENTKSSESSQGETNTNMELRKSSSFIMRKLKKSGSEANLTNSPPMHKSIRVEKKHFRLEDAFVSGGSALTIEIRFTTPSVHSLKSFSTNDLRSVGSSFNIGSTINSARSTKSSDSTEDIPDSARKRSFSLFGKLTGKHKKHTNISKDQTVAVLSFDSTELKNEWLFDLEASIKEAKQRAATKATKLQISSSFTN